MGRILALVALWALVGACTSPPAQEPSVRGELDAQAQAIGSLRERIAGVERLVGEARVGQDAALATLTSTLDERLQLLQDQLGGVVASVIDEREAREASLAELRSSIADLNRSVQDLTQSVRSIEGSVEQLRHDLAELRSDHELLKRRFDNHSH